MTQLFVTYLVFTYLSCIENMHDLVKMVEFGSRCSCKSYMLGRILKYLLQLRNGEFVYFSKSIMMPN